MFDSIPPASVCGLLCGGLGFEFQGRRVSTLVKFVQRLCGRLSGFRQRVRVERQLLGNASEPVARGPRRAASRLHDQIEPATTAVRDFSARLPRLEVFDCDGCECLGHVFSPGHPLDVCSNLNPMASMVSRASSISLAGSLLDGANVSCSRRVPSSVVIITFTCMVLSLRYPVGAVG